MGLAIYIHWPFCVSKCPYCAFNSVAHEVDYELFANFGDALLEELRWIFEKFSVESVSSIFLGGGTPSLLRTESIERILEFLQKNCEIENDVEISLEANPGTFDRHKLRALKDIGINRLSLGVQSFSDSNLKFLGRIYDGTRVRVAAESVAEIFENFSFDFMYGYCAQEKNSLEKDLNIAFELNCPHMSLYQLTIEPETPFYEKFLRKEIQLLDGNAQADQYDFIKNIAENHQMRRYEVSNYARKGYECRHNLSYWKYRDFIGIGPGAHSRISVKNEKFALENEKNPFIWMKKIKSRDETYYKKQKLTKFEELEEILIMGLRLEEGIDLKNVFKNISRDFFYEIATIEKLNFLTAQGFLKKQEKSDLKIQLTDEGILKLDSVVEFLLN